MKLLRCMAAAITLLGTLACAPAHAASAAAGYPSKPVRLIVPLPAGGAADIMARAIADHLQSAWGQPVVVDNRPGAGSTIGMDAVAKAPADGYTLGLGNIAANAISPAVRPTRFPYRPVQDFAPVSLVGITPLLLVVNAQHIPSRTLPEFVAYLKANEGKVAYGSTGSGSSVHLAMELLQLRTGTKMVHVPYKGSAPMASDLIAGQVVASMDAAATSWPYVQNGKLRALGVSTAERAFFAPNVPSISEFVPGFDIRPWHGVVAPAGTPPEIVAKLSKEIAAYVRSPAARAKLEAAGVVPVGSSGEELGRQMNKDLTLFKKVVQDAHVEAD